MNIKLKTILWSPIILCKYLGIIIKANSYRQNPTNLSPQERNDYMLKKAKWLLKFLKIDLEVKGYDKLPQSAILYPNHTSDLDSGLILCALEKQTKDKSINNKIANFLAKQELENHWNTRIPCSLIDTFFLNRKSLRESIKTIDSFGTFIKENKSLGVIFPEGTRSHDDKLLPFKPGSFKVAKSKFFPIVPVTINGAGQALNPKRSERLKIEVIFHDQVDPLTVQRIQTTTIANIVQNTVQKDYQPQEVYVDPKQPRKENPNKLTYAEKRERKLARQEAKANKYKDF